VTSLPTLTPHKSVDPVLIIVGICAAVASLAALGPLFVVGSVVTYVRIRKHGYRANGGLLGCGVLGGCAIAVAWPFFQAQYDLALVRDDAVSPFLLSVWSSAVLLSPLGGMVIDMTEKLADFFRPKTIEETVEDEKRKMARQEEKAGVYATRRGAHPPEPRRGILTCGTTIHPGRFPPYAGITQRAGWLQIAEDVLNQHVSVIGATGSGKTELLKRLIFELLFNTDRDVFLIDGKGDPELALAIRGLVYKARGVEAPIFRMGYGTAGAVYDGFRGDAEAIKNRLVELAGIPALEGNATHYANLHRNVLQLVCYAEEGPPQSFAELRRRLHPKWLRDTYKTNPSAMWIVELVTQEKGKEPNALTQLALQLLPVITELERKVAPHGFALEDTSCAIFSIRTQTVSDIAQRFLHYLIEDFKDYIGNRQTRPAELLLDEYAPFKSENMHSLLSLARSSNLGVGILTQDVATLGDEQMQQLILANTRTKILMATDFPEAIAKLAGTEYQPESSYQHLEGEQTGVGTTRIQHTFKIDPNEVAKLPAGQAFIIRQREVAKFYVHRVNHIPSAPPEPEHQEREEKPTTPSNRQQKPPPAIKL